MTADTQWLACLRRCPSLCASLSLSLHIDPHSPTLPHTTTRTHIHTHTRTTEQTNNRYVYAGTAFVLTIFQFILGTSLTAESTGRLRVDQRGTQLGIEHASFAGSRIFAPAAGNAVLASHGLVGVCAACSAVYAAAAAIWFAAGSVTAPPADAEEGRKKNKAEGKKAK